MNCDYRIHIDVVKYRKLEMIKVWEVIPKIEICMEGYPTDEFIWEVFPRWREVIPNS